MDVRVSPAILTVVGVLVVGRCTAAPPHEEARARMVVQQLRAEGITNADVLQVMREVPRHEFVPESERRRAYEAHPLPIGYGQTISQPYIVAAMTSLLEPQPDHVVLEVGTGSGYQAAVLSRLVKKVYTVEIIPELAERSRGTLARLGYDNVEVIHGDGHRGLPQHGPFDGIMVTAAPKSVPQALVEQLAVGGRLVIPVGEPQGKLTVIEKSPEGLVRRELFDVLFVPMTGTPRAEKPAPR